MFLIEKKAFGECTLVKIMNTQTGEYFSFLPEYGASLNQLMLQNFRGENHALLFENVDYEDLVTEGRSMYKGSKLFPFPNRINAGQYRYADQDYQLPINHTSEGHAIHGLVFDKRFEIIQENIGKESAAVTLSYEYDREYDGYPFSFTIEIIFELSVDGFSCVTFIRNRDTCKIPLGDGWHPYFKTGTQIDALFLSIPSSRKIETDHLMIPTGHYYDTGEFIWSKRIGKKHFDTCYKLPEDSTRSVVKITDQKKSVDLNIWMETGENNYKYVQLYTPDSRAYIAVEPMTCAPDAFNTKKDLILLDPGNEIKLLWGVFLS